MRTSSILHREASTRRVARGHLLLSLSFIVNIPRTEVADTCACLGVCVCVRSFSENWKWHILAHETRVCSLFLPFFARYERRLLEETRRVRRTKEGKGGDEGSPSEVTGMSPRSDRYDRIGKHRRNRMIDTAMYMRTVGMSRQCCEHLFSMAKRKTSFHSCRVILFQARVRHDPSIRARSRLI